MADSMFNIYDKLKEETAAPRQVAMDYSKIPEGRVAAAVMAQTAGMLGGQAMEAAGYQNAAQMQAQAMNEVKALYPNPTTRQEFIGMANEFKNRGMMDLWEKVMDQADSMTGKVTAAQQQKLEDLDATLDYLEVNKGFKLNPREAAYFKARIKEDVSLSMSGQVVDTAPNVFDQIVAARGNTPTGKGIGDTKLTEAGMEKKVGDLSTKVLKADLSDLDVALSDAEDMFTQYGDKNIPGLSQMNIIERQTEEGGANAGKIEAVKNILLKLRSGAAVTESEQQRFLNEISGTKVMTDSLWKSWIARIRKLVEQKKKDLFAGERQDVLDLYWSRQGTGYKQASQTTKAQQDVMSKYGLK